MEVGGSQHGPAVYRWKRDTIHRNVGWVCLGAGLTQGKSRLHRLSQHGPFSL
jgi:hypothetical protein